MPEKNVIAVDLDGTLAFDSPPGDPLAVGEPIPMMMQRLRQWLADGEQVVIFTARLNAPDVTDKAAVVAAVQDWLEQQGLPRLRVTDRKLWAIKEFWDDRAVQVIPNSGVAPLGDLPS